MRPLNLRNSFLRVALIALFAMVVCVPTHGQLASIQTEQASIDSFIKYYNNGVKFYEQRDYNSAIPIFQQAANLCKEIYGDNNPDYAICISRIALCHYCSGDYNKSIELNNIAINKLKSSLGETDINYVTVLNNQALSYYSVGNLTRAIELYEQALAIYKNVLGENHPDYAASLNSLAACYDALGNNTKAIELYKLALVVQKNVYGESHLEYATTLGNLAEHYRISGDYSRAIELNEQVLMIRKNSLGDNHPHYAISLNNLALCYKQLGDFEKAIKLYTQAIEIQKILGENHPSYANSLSNLAVCYHDMGNYASALELNEQVLSIYKNTGIEGQVHYATALANIADVYRSMCLYAKSIELNNQALAIKKKLLGEDHPGYANLLNNMAVLYNDMGDYKRAIELQEKALIIIKHCLGESHPAFAQSLNNIAISYAELGNYTKAKELTEKSLCIRINSFGKNHPKCIESMCNLAAYYVDIGDYTKAIELTEECLELSKHNLGKNNLYMAPLMITLADLYINFDKNAKAIELAEKALVLTKESVGENHKNYAAAMHTLANIYAHNGDARFFERALKLQLQALVIRSQLFGKNHPDVLESISWFALYNLCNNNFSTAEKMSRQIIDINHDAVWKNTIAYATYIYSCYKNNKISDLLSTWRSFFNKKRQFILSQFRYLTEKHRATLWEISSPDIIISLHQYAKLCKESAEASKIAYNSLLFSKGLILSSSIEFDRVIKASGNEELLAQFEELRTTRAILNTYYNKPIAERPKGEVERLEARAEELEKIMIAGSKEYADFTKYLNVEWENVRDALGENEVAIEFLAAEQFIDETEPYYAAMVLRKGWDAPKYVDLLTAKELKEYCVRGSMMYSGHGAFELYNHIWAKLGEYINEGDNVYFSPDGLLHQINIELFYDVERKRANEKYNLYRVSSTREVCLERETPAQKSAVLYGGLKYNMSNDSLILESNKYRGESSLRTFRADSTMKTVWSPLPATKVEVENIDEVCHQHNIASNIYATTVGNEESFKALSGKKTPILHLATHGFFYKNEEAKKRSFFERFDMMGQQRGGKVDNSLKRSGLILAGAQRAWNGEEIPANVEDGILLAEEISTMDLSGTDIVVLSACETGLGEITSDGVFGLQRAFKKAGVKTLIMSLWKVDDEATSLFMQSFYKEWLGGKSKRDAFAYAQKTVREYSDDTKSFKNPKFWAAFILLDDYQK